MSPTKGRTESPSHINTKTENQSPPWLSASLYTTFRPNIYMTQCAIKAGSATGSDIPTGAINVI